MKQVSIFHINIYSWIIRIALNDYIITVHAE